MDANSGFLVPVKGDAAFAKLMSSPADASRRKVKRRPAGPKAPTMAPPIASQSLADIVRGFTPTGKPRRPYVSPLSRPLPTYADWLVARGFKRKDAERAAAAANAEARAFGPLPDLARPTLYVGPARPPNERRSGKQRGAHEPLELAGRAQSPSRAARCRGDRRIAT